MKEKLSIIYLKTSLLFLGLCVVAIFIGLTYLTITTDDIEYYRPVLWIISLSIIPAVFAMYYFFILITFLGRDMLFTKQSIINLGRVKYSLFSTGAVYLAGMPIIFYAAEQDDAPGVILIGLVIIAVFFTLGIFFSVIQNALQRAQ